MIRIDSGACPVQVRIIFRIIFSCFVYLFILHVVVYLCPCFRGMSGSGAHHLPSHLLDVFFAVITLHVCSYFDSVALWLHSSLCTMTPEPTSVLVAPSSPASLSPMRSPGSPPLKAAKLVNEDDNPENVIAKAAEDNSLDDGGSTRAG